MPIVSGGGGGGGFANPMTTAGDLIIENNTPAPARLAVGSGTQVLGVSAGLPAWVAQSGGAISQLSDTTLANAATTIDSGTFATTANHLLIITHLRHSTAELINSASAFLNNDTTTTNYETQRLTAVSGGTISGDITNGNRPLTTFGASAPANQFAPGLLMIPTYGGTSYLKNVLSKSGGMTAFGGSPTSWQEDGSMNWNSTAAVSRIVLQAPGASSFAIGSRMTCYGLT